MGRLFINATKNFGSKITNAISSSDRIDGIHFSLADIPKKQIVLLPDDVPKLAELPLCYLLKDSIYVTPFLNRNIESGAVRPTTINNNRLMCLFDNIDFSYFETLPITPRMYAKKRKEFLNSISDYYEKYFKGGTLMTPTFVFSGKIEWEEILMIDVLSMTKSYIEKNSKNEVIMSILVDSVLLNSNDLAQKISEYLKDNEYIDAISLTISSSTSMYYYDDNEYKNIMIFLKELKNKNIKIYLQYSGIKDAVFSILGIERFSVGWFGSYRNFDMRSKGIEGVENQFGKKIKKILTEYYFTEIPLDYLSVLSNEKFSDIVGESKEEALLINFPKLEQIYWKEMLKIIEKNDIIEENLSGDQLIGKRSELLEEKILAARANLEELIILLQQHGRFDDADKIKKTNVMIIDRYLKIINYYKKRFLRW